MEPRRLPPRRRLSYRTLQSRRLRTRCPRRCLLRLGPTRLLLRVRRPTITKSSPSARDMSSHSRTARSSTTGWPNTGSRSLRCSHSPSRASSLYAMVSSMACCRLRYVSRAEAVSGSPSFSRDSVCDGSADQGRARSVVSCLEHCVQAALPAFSKRFLARGYSMI